MGGSGGAVTSPAAGLFWRDFEHLLSTMNQTALWGTPWHQARAEVLLQEGKGLHGS